MRYGDPMKITYNKRADLWELWKDPQDVTLSSSLHHLIQLKQSIKNEMRAQWDAKYRSK